MSKPNDSNPTKVKKTSKTPPKQKTKKIIIAVASGLALVGLMTTAILLNQPRQTETSQQTINTNPDQDQATDPDQANKPEQTIDSTPSLSSIDFRLTCDNGYELRGESCISKSTVDTSKQFCRQGELKNGACVITETAATTRSCPKGSVAEGDSCIIITTAKRATVTYHCPEGMFSNGEACYGFHGKKACPPETLLQPNIESSIRCFTSKRPLVSQWDPCRGEPTPEHQSHQGVCYYNPKPMVCPDGMAYDHENCYVRKQDRIKKYSCDAGYTLHGETCRIFRTTKHQTTCPDGFNLSDGRCTRQQSVQAETSDTCSGGGLIKIDNKCHRQRAATKTCPSGYNLENDKCVKTD